MKEYKLKINGNDYTVNITEIEEEVANVEVNGTPFKVEFEKPISKKPMIAIMDRPKAAISPKTNIAPVATVGTAISSPLPGVIIEVSVKEGATVKKGDKLMVLEAMKMENSIEASVDGTVQSIKVNQGDSVLEGAVLAIIG